MTELPRKQPRKQLKVKFMKRILTWRLKTYPYDLISTEKILEWANEWSSRELGLEGIVPKFILCPEKDEEPDIRVRFECKYLASL